MLQYLAARHGLPCFRQNFRNQVLDIRTLFHAPRGQAKKRTPQIHKSLIFTQDMSQLILVGLSRPMKLTGAGQVRGLNRFVLLFQPGMHVLARPLP